MTKIINYPVKIHSCNLNAPKELREKWVKEAYRLQNKNKNRLSKGAFKEVFDESNNNKVSVSEYKLWKETKVYNKLLENILLTFFQNLNFNPFIKSLKSYVIKDAWVAIYDKGQQANPHDHIPSYYSFCYYIDNEQPSSPMNFSPNNLNIETQTDQIIYFPSFITHSVKPSPSKRIVLAGNIIGNFVNESIFTIND